MEITPLYKVYSPEIPLEFSLTTSNDIDGIETAIRTRTEKGWTLDFVFNREEMPWISGGTFYYWGIKDETIPEFYMDNNLTFSFTSDGRIKWSAFRYPGRVSSGQTPILCSGGTSNDFEITISFERYANYEDCEILNEGGLNDQITGWTVTNPLGVMTGDTATYELIETLNEKWYKERNHRLGVLKIYLNGRPIYKLKDWEEVIPSVRGSENPIVQMFGETTNFNIKRIEYFEEPLSYLEIRDLYLILTKPYYQITECAYTCNDV